MKRQEFIKQNSTGRILDVGCEAGEFHKIIYDKNLFGLDIKVKKYKKKIVKGDAQFMPFKSNSFDTIVAGELIEHLPYPENFLKESNRILRDRASIVITTPNKKSWVNRIFKSSFVKSHVSLLDISSLKKITNKYFKIEKLILLPYDNVSSWGSKHKRFFRIRRLVHIFLPQDLQENMLVLGRKRC